MRLEKIVGGITVEAWDVIVLGDGPAALRADGADRGGGSPPDRGTSATTEGGSGERRSAGGPGPRHRPGRLRHHAGRDERRPPHEFLPGRYPESRTGLRPDAALLHDLFLARHHGAIEGGRDGARRGPRNAAAPADGRTRQTRRAAGRTVPTRRYPVEQLRSFRYQPNLRIHPIL